METMKGDLADFRALCGVIEHGGVTSAANILGESKGTVSRRITRLEEQLGLKLLNRSSRAVSPTEAGMTFYHRCLQALAIIDEGATELRNTNQVPSGLLRVTMPVDLGLSIFPSLMADFLQLYPQIRVEVLLSENMLDLKTHQIDIALRIATTLADSAYIFHRLTAISAQLFASPQYLARRGLPQVPTDLLNHEVLLHQKFPGIAPLTLNQGHHQCSVKLNVRAIANNIACLQQLAIGGAGIALLPNFLVKASCDSGQLVPVLPQWSLGDKPKSLYLLHEGWRLLPAKVICFRNFLCDRLGTTL